MVLIECKRLPKEEHSKDYDIFLMSLPGDTKIAVAAEAVRTMQNARVRLQWMVVAARQLAKDSVPEEQKHVLLGPADDAERYLSLERTTQRLLCEQEELDKLIATLKGGAMIAFPSECSGADADRRLVAVTESETASDVDRSRAHRILSVIDDGATTETTLSGPVTMWWSGKALDSQSDFIKYIGKNEKTKITVKLTAENAAAPPREPAVDVKTQSEMVSYYYRKQEEMKKMVEDDDISFGNSDWANPHGLKQQLHGFGQVKFRPS